MKLAHHYRVLGLRRSASFRDVKKAYRQLVRRYHPDINPDKAAIDRFIKINSAYTALCEALQTENSQGSTAPQSTSATAAETGTTERLNLHELKLKLEKMGLGNFGHSPRTQTTSSSPFGEGKPTANGSEPTVGTHPKKEENNSSADRQPDSAPTQDLGTQDLGLKQEAYEQLKTLLRQQKFPRAVALIEGLAQRIPSDAEINQWQAIVYQRWGRQLISQGQFQKARLYLKKALKTDPNNPSLNNEVARDLGLLKHLQAAEAAL